MGWWSGVREAADEATPGQWGWFGHSKGDMHLATVRWGRFIVMSFARLGMSGAQPQFQAYSEREGGDPRSWKGRLVDGKAVAILEAPYRDDIVGFDNPDARWLALASPSTVRPLLNIADAAAAYAACSDLSAEEAVVALATLRTALAAEPADGVWSRAVSDHDACSKTC
jgi:hypothetical protein